METLLYKEMPALQGRKGGLLEVLLSLVTDTDAAVSEPALPPDGRPQPPATLPMPQPLAGLEQCPQTFGCLGPLKAQLPRPSEWSIPLPRAGAHMLPRHVPASHVICSASCSTYCQLVAFPAFCPGPFSNVQNRFLFLSVGRSAWQKGFAD